MCVGEQAETKFGWFTVDSKRWASVFRYETFLNGAISFFKEHIYGLGGLAGSNFDIRQTK